MLRYVPLLIYSFCVHLFALFLPVFLSISFLPFIRPSSSTMRRPATQTVEEEVKRLRKNPTECRGMRGSCLSSLFPHLVCLCFLDGLLFFGFFCTRNSLSVRCRSVGFSLVLGVNSRKWSLHPPLFPASLSFLVCFLLACFHVLASVSVRQSIQASHGGSDTP